MAYNCWDAPVLWETSAIYSPDLPNPNVKSWVTLNITGGVPLISGKTYRITIHTIAPPIAPSNWEEWDGDEWIENPSGACMRCWGANTEGDYVGGSWASGCNYGGQSGSWTQWGGGHELTFRVYDSGGIQDSYEDAIDNKGYFQLWNAGSQTFRPSENYTAVKIELMLNRCSTIRRGYLIVKLERVTMATPGFIWVEGTKLAYTDSDGVKRLKTGTLDGAAGQTAGYLWIEGTKLRYIDADGDERYIEGAAGGSSGNTPGYLWVEVNNIRYIDETAGQERYFQGVLS